MVVASVISKKTYLGVEVTPGTEVPANRFLEDVSLTVVPVNTFGTVKPSGSTMDTGSPLIMNYSTFTVGDGSYVGYNSLYYLLRSLMGAPSTSTPGGGTLSREHVFTYNPDGLNVRPTYTLKTGYRNGTAESVARATFDSFGFGFNRQSDATLSGGGFAKNPDMSASILVSEIWTLTIDATGGDYTVTFNGQTTAAIAENATAGAVQTAMEALSNVAAGGVDLVVTGSAGGPYTFTWQDGGAYGGVNLTTATTNAGGLTGGASTATFAVVQQGGITTIPEAAVTATSWGVFVDAIGGTIGTTRFRPYSGEFSFTGLTAPDWVVDETEESFDSESLQKPAMTANILGRNDSASRSLFDDFLAGQHKLMRFRSLGPIIEGSLAYEFHLDCVVGPADNIGQFGNQNGAETMPFPLKVLSRSSNFSGGFSAFLRNVVDPTTMF